MKVSAPCVMRMRTGRCCSAGAYQISAVMGPRGRAVKVGRSQLPGSFTLDVPALDLGVTITVDSWDELGQIPDVFTLTPPAGAAQKDLLQALQEEAVKRWVESVEPRPQP